MLFDVTTSVLTSGCRSLPQPWATSSGPARGSGSRVALVACSSLGAFSLPVGVTTSVVDVPLPHPTSALGDFVCLCVRAVPACDVGRVLDVDRWPSSGVRPLVR